MWCHKVLVLSSLLVVCVLTGLLGWSTSVGRGRRGVSPAVPSWWALVIAGCRRSSCHFKVTVLLWYAVELLSRVMKWQHGLQPRDVMFCVSRDWRHTFKGVFYSLSQYFNFVELCKFAPQHLNNNYLVPSHGCFVKQWALLFHSSHHLHPIISPSSPTFHHIFWWKMQVISNKQSQDIRFEYSASNE